MANELEITDLHEAILKVIAHYNERGSHPTYREVAEGVGRHVSQVYDTITELEKLGMLTRKRRAWRSLSLTERGRLCSAT